MKGLKKHIKALIAAAVACVCAVPCAASPVFANSGVRYEYGVTGADVLMRNEESVLAVESEKLTFNIVDFPDYYDFSNYQSTVTADYKFVNTSDNTVITSMAFPIGVDPQVYGDVRKPEIKVNGDRVNVQTRHTYGNSYDLAESAKYILDDFYTDDFYTPEMPVTHYSVTVEEVYSDEFYRVVGQINCGDGARFVVWNGTEESVVQYLDGGTNKFDIYVVGDAADFNCTWKFEKYQRYFFSGGDYVPTNVTFPISQTAEQTTLKEWLLSYRENDSTVSETDWYNGGVVTMGANKYTPLSRINNMSDRSFRAWYVYDVQVDPHGSFTNTVTAPLIPSIYYSYDPYVYEYEYYLSPAASWQSFGSLEVVVNTDMFMSNQSLPLEKCEGGYRATFDTLPEGELEFRLCASENPSHHRPGVVLFKINKTSFSIAAVIAAILLAGFVTGIVYLVVARKKK